MSLINNMLKELEKRKAEVAISFPTFLTYQNKPVSNHYYIYALVFIIFSLIISFFLFFSIQEQNIHLAPMLYEVPVKTDVKVSANKEIGNQSGFITGMTMQLKEGMIEITFLLDHPVLYRLTANNMINEFSLILDHTKMQAALPSFKHLNSAIERLTMKENKDQVIFKFILRQGVSIKYVNLNNETTHPELVVAIGHDEMQGEQLNLSTKPIRPLVKIPALQTRLLQHYQSALQDIEKAEYLSAIKKLSSILKMNPRYRDARVSLAALLIDQGKSNEATSLIDAGLHFYPEYVPFVELKARLLTADGEIKKALNLLLTVSPSMDENPEYHAFIAALYERNNNDLLAAKIYKQLLTIYPNKSNWWLGLGVSLDKMGQSKAAFNAYTKAMAEGHLNPDAFSYIQNRLQALQGKSL